MNIKTKFIIFVIIVVFIVAGFGISMSSRENGGKNIKLEQFARCISDSGAKFYGTFWCFHCQTQKKQFGPAQKYLPYVECATPDGKEQLQVCKDAGIEESPTWIFADKSQLLGELSFSTLAEKTSCPLPE